MQDLLTTILKNDSNDEGAKVFYLKMKGDYCRYLAEVAKDDKRKGKKNDTNDL